MNKASDSCLSCEVRTHFVIASSEPPRLTRDVGLNITMSKGVACFKKQPLKCSIKTHFLTCIAVLEFLKHVCFLFVFCLET